MTENKYNREKEIWSEEEIQEYVDRLLSDARANLENLNSMAVNSKYENYRIKAIDSYFRNANKFLKLKRSIDKFKRGDVDVESGSDDEPEEDVEVRFGD